MTKKAVTKKLTDSAMLLVLVFSLLAVICFGSVSILKTLYPRRYSEFVEIYSAENNLSEDFVFAVIECESGFDKNAVSYLGAEGLMQIMPETFDHYMMLRGETGKYTAEDLFDPAVNIDYGSYILHHHIEMFGDEKTAALFRKILFATEE